MSNQEHIAKIQDVIKDVKFAMMSTTNKKGDIHAWPMTTNEVNLDMKRTSFLLVLTLNCRQTKLNWMSSGRRFTMPSLSMVKKMKTYN